jgi:hypothetical protein
MHHLVEQDIQHKPNGAFTTKPANCTCKYVHEYNINSTNDSFVYLFLHKLLHAYNNEYKFDIF